MSPVSVSCRMSSVSGLLSRVSCHMSPVSRLLFFASCCIYELFILINLINCLHCFLNTYEYKVRSYAGGHGFKFAMYIFFPQNLSTITPENVLKIPKFSAINTRKSAKHIQNCPQLTPKRVSKCHNCPQLTLESVLKITKLFVDNH